jgi:hypothetical protein
MKKPAKPKPANSDRDILLVFQVAASISIASFFYYLQKSDLLLYGDAVAHINIARRVFDSRTPGLLQLGTVWLPLPHRRLNSVYVGVCFQRCRNFSAGANGIT